MIILYIQASDCLKEPIAKAFVDVLDARWKSCLTRFNNDEERIKFLSQPYLAILYTIVTALSEAKDQPSLTPLIRQLQARQL